MSDYASAAAGVKTPRQQPQEPRHADQKPASLCCINGCELPGTISSSTTGSSEWFCRLHFGAQYSENGQITALANNRHRLYRLAFRCVNVPPGRPVLPELRAALKRHGREDLLNCKGGPVTVQRIGRHMFEVLDDECRPGQKTLQPKQEPEKRPNETWTSASDYVGAFDV